MTDASEDAAAVGRLGRAGCYRQEVIRLFKSVVLASLALALGACTAGATSEPPTESAMTTGSASATATQTTAGTPNLGHPLGLIAIGHSGLTGEGTGGTFEAVKANSWATGTEPLVNSVYLRLVAVLPETAGHVANSAKGGAPASELMSQATQALAVVPAPALAIIQTVDNDIQCDGANVSDVGKGLAAALAVIHQSSPNTKILVVGQLGRPSVAFVTALVEHNPGVKADLTWDDDCSFFGVDGKLRESGFKKLGAVIDAYEAETARVCVATPNCATDGGVRRAWVDTIANFAPDYSHLNVQGQAAEAELIWPVVAATLGP